MQDRPDKYLLCSIIHDSYTLEEISETVWRDACRFRLRNGIFYQAELRVAIYAVVETMFPAYVIFLFFR